VDEIVHREEDDSRALLLLVVLLLLLLHEYDEDEDVMVAEDSVDNTEIVEDGGCTPMHAPVVVVDMMIAKDGTKVVDAMAVVGTPMILLLLLLLGDVAYNRPTTTTTTVSSALHSLLLDLYHLVQERSKTMMILSDTPQLHHSQQHQHHY
jgi:hypothetical protein